MTHTVQVEQDGRVRIPEDFLSDLHLDKGSTIRLAVNEDNTAPSLTIEGQQCAGILIEEDGLLVWKSPGPYTSEEDRQIILAMRAERDLRNLGVYAETLD